MASIRREPLDVAAAWKRADVESAGDWIHALTAEEVAELDTALAHAKRTGKALRELTREDFSLRRLATATDRWLRDLDEGRGFLLVRGVPVHRYTDEEAALVYWGLGLHLGTAVSQNAAGDVLGHVRDVGADRGAEKVRLYKTRDQLGFHTDGADIIGLLCLRPAKAGGVSRIVSSVTIYNEVLRRRPDLIPVLYEPFPFDRNDEQPPGEPPFFMLPLCWFEGGRLRTFYIGWYIRDSQRHSDAPRLTPAQIEVIDLIDMIAADPALHLDMDFLQGDIQLLKNAVTLHARTEFEDFDEPARKRHLLRLWLTARTPFRDGDDFLRGGIPHKEGALSDTTN